MMGWLTKQVGSERIDQSKDIQPQISDRGWYFGNTQCYI